MGRKRIILILKGVCTALLLAYVFHSTGLFGTEGRAELMEVVADGSVYYLIVTLLVTMLVEYVSTIKWYALAKVHGFTATLSRLFSYYLVGRLFNVFLPGSIGGDIIRIRLLARHSGRYTDSVAIIFLERLTGLIVLLILSVIALAVKAQTLNIDWVRYVLLIGVSTIGLMCWAILSEKPIQLINKIELLKTGKLQIVLEKVNRFRSSLLFYKDHPRALAIAFFNSFLFYVAAILNTWVTMLVVYPSASLVDLMFAVPVILVILNIPISIGGVGLTEFAFTLILGLFGVSPAVALTTALLFHIKTLFSATIGGVIFATLSEKEELKEELPDRVD